MEKTKAPQPLFIPPLLNEKVTVRMTQGQPLTGVLRGYNAYELLLEINGKLYVVFKGAVSHLEVLDVSRYNARRAKREGGTPTEEPLDVDIEPIEGGKRQCHDRVAFASETMWGRSTPP